MKTDILTVVLLTCLMWIGDSTVSAMTTDKVIDVENQEKIHSYDNFIVDSIINGCRIEYRIINTDKVFYSNKTAYLDREIILTVKKNDVYILNKRKFSRYDFSSIIPSGVIEEILLWKGDIENVNSEYVEVSVNATIPETDMSYDLRLMIRNDGSVDIFGEEVAIEEDDWW